MDGLESTAPAPVYTRCRLGDKIKLTLLLVTLSGSMPENFRVHLLVLLKDPAFCHRPAPGGSGGCGGGGGRSGGALESGGRS